MVGSADTIFSGDFQVKSVATERHHFCFGVLWLLHSPVTMTLLGAKLPVCAEDVTLDFREWKNRAFVRAICEAPKLLKNSVSTF